MRLSMHRATAPVTVIEQIEDDIKRNKLMVFMKGYPESPMCGFSMFVCRILDSYGMRFNICSDLCASC